LPDLAAPRQWGIEGAGAYGRGLAQALVAAGERVLEVPGLATAHERRRSRGREREKTDATDALAIARVVLRDADRLPPIMPDGQALECRLLTEQRRNLIGERTRLLNQLYAQLDGAGYPTRPLFRARNHRGALRALLTLAPSDASALAALRARLVAQLAQLVLDLDAHITTLTAALEALAPRVAPHLLAIPGCGALTATAILGEAGDVDRFPTEARFGAYAGVAPIAASSGERVRHRLSRRGNRQLNAALHVIAVTQRRWHPLGQAYLTRKVAEGKSPKEALRSLKRQLANVVFRALKADLRLGTTALLT
jgi:transposase